jgi:hypothetical protein
MIIWIASYPKSGNTWVRSLLGHYYFSKNAELDFSVLRNIPNFSVGDFINDKKLLKEPMDIPKLWLKIQKYLSIKYKKNLFFKTHQANLSVNGFNFTSKDFCAGCIYIIRDPRNVVTSYKNFENRTYEDVLNIMTDKNSFLAGTDYFKKKFGFNGFEIIGSWSENYNSWVHNRLGIPVCLVKYEDLLHNTIAEFEKIFNFIKKINKTENIIFNRKRAIKIIEETSFEKLKNNEKSGKFTENSSRPKNVKTNFFNMGKKNDWRKILPEEIKEKIERIFKKEMKELKYLK